MTRPGKMYPESKLTAQRLIEIARKYFVQDLSGAAIPGSRINNILKQVESGSPLSNFTLQYLQKNGFHALLSYVKNEISFVDFQKAAEPEQAKRQELTKARISWEEAERRKKERPCSLKPGKSRNVLQQGDGPMKMTLKPSPSGSKINSGPGMTCHFILKENTSQDS